MTVWQTIVEQFPFLIDGLLRSSVIFIAMLGVVYIFGRMLEICGGDRARNAIAIVTAFGTSFWLARIYNTELIGTPHFWWLFVIHALAACILFVLIGWRLFSRVDRFFDRKFAEDMGRELRPKRAKRTKKTT